MYKIKQSIANPKILFNLLLKDIWCVYALSLINKYFLIVKYSVKNAYKTPFKLLSAPYSYSPSPFVALVQFKQTTQNSSQSSNQSVTNNTNVNLIIAGTYSWWTVREIIPPSLKYQPKAERVVSVHGYIDLCGLSLWTGVYSNRIKQLLAFVTLLGTDAWPNKQWSTAPSVECGEGA